MNARATEAWRERLLQAATSPAQWILGGDGARVAPHEAGRTNAFSVLLMFKNRRPGRFGDDISARRWTLGR